MTKTLTEQWRDKELKDGDYYVLNKAGDIVCDYYIEILGHFDSVLTENVKEVLAPVPSYEEYKRLVSNSDESVTRCRQLEKKIFIATKALKEIAFGIGDLESDYGYHYELSKKALKEIEEVE